MIALPAYSPDWYAIEVPHPGIVWGRFADAIGLDQMKEWYGEGWPPADKRPGESVYVWRDLNIAQPIGSNPAGWLSLYIDQITGKDAYMSRGVFPESHGKGLGKFMRDYAETWAREWKCRSMNIFVSKKNAQHLVNVLNDPYWEFDFLNLKTHEFGFSHTL